MSENSRLDGDLRSIISELQKVKGLIQHSPQSFTDRKINQSENCKLQNELSLLIRDLQKVDGQVPDQTAEMLQLYSTIVGAYGAGIETREGHKSSKH